MATPSHFLNQIKDQFYKTKIELAIEWETHWAAEMRGPQLFKNLYLLFLKIENKKQFLIVRNVFLLFILENKNRFASNGQHSLIFYFQDSHAKANYYFTLLFLNKIFYVNCN